MIDLKDIKTPNPIPNLKREIGSIKKDLAIPKAIQTGIVGSTLGYMFGKELGALAGCLLYTSPSPRDRQKSRMPSSA